MISNDNKLLQINRFSLFISYCINKKDGFCNQSKAHFGLPWVGPGTIVVNVTWMKSRFNAYQTHRSMYPSIFNHLRAIARHWSEIATFSYPVAFNAPIGGVPIGIPGKKFDPQKTRIMGLPGSEDSLMMGWAILTQYQRVTDRRLRQGQTSSLYQERAQYDWHTLKIQIATNMYL